VVGDRLFTDIMMANMIGAWSVWVKDGVVNNDGVVSDGDDQLGLWFLMQSSSRDWRRGCRMCALD
jgi:ribonucleotide monophosphatase NagD (HAD superfamily)